MEDQPDKKGIIKALIFAILLAFLGIGILGWQYQRIEKEQIPALEEKIEKKEVEDALDDFMRLRVEKNEAGAMRYLTEGAVEAKERKEFLLIDNFDSYEVLGSEKLAEDRYRYVVKVYEDRGLSDLVEVIILIKISDQYYVDSVQLAG